MQRLITPILALGLALGFSAFAVGCTDDTRSESSLAVFIVSTTPDPPEGHAPVGIGFEVDFSRGGKDDTAFQIMWDFGDGATLLDELNPVHTFATAGEYTVTVTVTDRESNESGSAEIPVVIRESADLAVSSLQARPGQIVAGEQLQILFSVRSERVAVQYPFSSIVFLTQNASADAADIDEFVIIDKERFESMPATGEDGSVLDRNLDLNVPESVPSGEWYVGVLIDSDLGIGEIDESNNLLLTEDTVTIKNPSTDGPDLEATSVIVNPRRTRILSSARIDFTVENNGPSAALLFSYAVYISSDDIFDEAFDTHLLEGTVEGVTANSSVEVRDLLVPINPAIMEPGDYYIIVVMDPRGELTELDETNNVLVASSPILVSDDEILDADIVVTDFRVTPDHTFLGGSFTAEVDLVNQGMQRTGSFICTIYLSDDQVLRIEEDLVMSSLNVADLPGDTTQTIDSVIAVPSFYQSGNYWAFVFCDASGVIVEFDEDNNVQRYTDEVFVALSAEVDISPSNLVIDPVSPISDGTDSTLTFDACNSGSTGSSPNLMRVLLSQDAAPDPDDVVAFEGTLPGIGPGECTTVEVGFNASCVDWNANYQLLVQVDVRDILSETDENNNVAQLAGGLTIEGPFCNCSDDSGEPNDFSTVPFPLVVGPNTGYSLCGGDADWYSIALSTDDSVRVTMTHDPSLGELDVALYDPARTLLERSGDASDGTDSVDTWLVPIPGDYLIQILPADTGAINIYDLDVEVLTTTSGVNDLAAVDVMPAETMPELNTPFDVSLAVVNLGSLAWPAPMRVSLYLTQDTVVDPMVDVELDQFEVPAIQGYERLDFVRPVVIPGDTQSGFWRIGAIADVLDEVTETDETNNASVSSVITIDTTCFDPLEANDSLPAAVEIVPGDTSPAPGPNYPGLVVCKTNPDFYRIPVQSGKTLEVSVEAGMNAGDFDVELLNAAGDLIDASQTSNTIEEVSMPIVVGDQDVFLHIFQLPSAFNLNKSEYDLTVTMVDADPALICNADFEPNDTFNTATSLIDAAAFPTQLGACPETDKDYYRISLSAGTTIDIGLDTTSAKLRATLYDTNRLPVPGETIFNPQSDTISYTAPLGGTYYLHVYPGAGAARQELYSIVLSGLDGTDLQPEMFTAAPQVASAGDAVQFAVQISNSGLVDSVAFDVDLVLSDDALITTGDTVLGSFSGLGPALSQDAVALADKVDLPTNIPSGQYYLGLIVDPQDAIAELDEFNNDLALPIDITAFCTADMLESPIDNNASSRATDLDANAPISAATLCPNDEDWYVVTSTASQDFTFTATFNHGFGDLDMYVYDSSLNLIGQSRSLTDDEVTSVTSAGGGDVFVQIRGFTGSVSNSYQLDFTSP